MLSLDTKDSINELAREGWVQIWEGLVSLHPVVREVIRRWEWAEQDQKVCGLVMYGIWKQIVLEAEKDHSRKPIQNMQMIKKRMENIDQRQAVNYEKLRTWLNVAEEVLDYYRNESGLQKTNMYYALLYQSFMNVPLEREDYILTHAREWLSVLSEDDWK